MFYVSCIAGRFHTAVPPGKPPSGLNCFMINNRREGKTCFPSSQAGITISLMKAWGWERTPCWPRKLLKWPCGCWFGNSETICNPEREEYLWRGMGRGGSPSCNMLKFELVQVIEDDTCCPKWSLNGYEKLWIHIWILFYICMNLRKSIFLFFLFLWRFFNVDYFESVFWICYSITSVLCFDFTSPEA